MHEIVRIKGKQVAINHVSGTTCLCYYTGKEFNQKDGIILGPVIPQATISFLCSPEATEARKHSVRAFNETEKNCNTCAKLVRFPHDRAELMPGKCENIPKDHPYHRGDHFLFCPDDWMGMECYEARNAHQ